MNTDWHLGEAIKKPIKFMTLVKKGGGSKRGVFNFGQCQGIVQGVP